MPTSEVSTIFLTYTTLGSYLKDPKNIETDFPKQKTADIQQTLNELLNNLIIEAKSIDEIKGFDLGTVKEKITDSYNECINECTVIEVAQGAEDTLQLAADAANVALVVASWTVFGTIGLSIAALVAECAAQGMELEVEKLEGSIITSIADMGLKAYNDPALNNIKTYQDSSDHVTINIAKLELGGNKAIVRQALLGLAETSKTVEEMRKNLIYFSDTYNTAPEIIGKYQKLAELIINGDGGPSAQVIINDLNNLSIPKFIIKGVILLVGAAGITSAFSSKKFSDEIAGMKSDINVISPEERATFDETVAKAERMSRFIKRLAVLGAATDTIFLALTIYEQVKFINKIKEKIEQRKSDLIEYYTNFHNAISGNS